MLNLQAIELEKIKSKSSFEKSYQFFDSNIVIKTNLQDILEGFDKIYWRFRSQQDPLNPSRELYLIQEASQLILVHENEYQILENQTVTPNLFLFIFSYILPQVKSHFLVHAATLSYRGQGTVITAHSTSGKTTLAVELIKRGIDFLSDELAPIHRVTHLIDPFPRSIGLRNLKLHHLEDLSNGKIHQSPNAKGEIKWMIDPENLRANSVGHACPCRNVIFIEPQYEEDSTHESLQILEASMTKLEPSLLLAIQRIQGVVAIEAVLDRMFPMIRVSHEKESCILQEIEESAKVYGSALVSIVNGRTRKPDFNLPPILKSMAKFEGTFELAKMILNAHPEAALMDEFKQSPARMLTALADITPRVQFYKLMVGRLDLMTDRVENLIKEQD